MAGYKLELSKALERLDKRDRNFYNSLSDEEKKGFQPLVLMRYMSSVPNHYSLSYLSLVMTNEVVNMNFWDLSSEPELMAKLLATCGHGTKTYHKWIPMTSTKKSNALDALVKDEMKSRRWNPNKTEIEIFLSKMTEQDVREMCANHGKSKDDEKKIVAEFKKAYM